MLVTVHRGVQILAEGGICAIPTETVYGLAASARSEAAVRAIFAAKRRPADHPLILHVADVATAREHSVWDARADALVDLWPGPLALVLPARNVLGVITGGHPTVALRVPAHPVALEILAAVGPLAAPSANGFGRVSPTRAEHVESEFPDLPVVDGGPCSVGVESTIVALLDGPPQLLRPGGISLETLMERLGPVQVGGAIAVPGTLPSHYAPRAKVELVPFGTAGADIPAGAPEDHARALYDALRSLDARGATTIICEMADSVGIGVAVNDRLRRAAHR